MSARNAARAAGLTRYPSPSVCSQGHKTWRHTATGGCVDCAWGRPYKRTSTNEARGTSMWDLNLRTDDGASQAMRALGWRVWTSRKVATHPGRPERWTYRVEAPAEADVPALGRVLGWWG